jgi:hypothetical protein
VGKTELLLNTVGFHVEQDPAPIMVVMPTERDAETWSKDRFSPMARDTPCLRGRISNPRSRDGNNKILHKKFPGGHLTIVGANAPSGLASRPIRILLCDEVDRYPFSVDSPILQELTRIFEHPIKEHVILIDDARDFLGVNGYPTVKALHRFVRARSPYRMRISNDIIRLYNEEL